jgi:hypothetical protein
MTVAKKTTTAKKAPVTKAAVKKTAPAKKVVAKKATPVTAAKKTTRKTDEQAVLDLKRKFTTSAFTLQDIRDVFGTKTGLPHAKRMAEEKLLKHTGRNAYQLTK